MDSCTPSPQLTRARESEYLTTVVLSDAYKEKYQYVYGSQSYGTFFSIFGKFEFERIGTKTKLIKICFRLINYKGVVNMGIVGFETLSSTEEKSLNIRFKLKGLQKGVNDLPYIVPPENQFIDTGYFINIERVIEPLEVSGGDEVMNPVFDEEFYFRDGLFEIDSEVSDLEKKVEAIFPSNKKRSALSRCPKGRASVIVM